MRSVICKQVWAFVFSVCRIACPIEGVVTGGGAKRCISLDKCNSKSVRRRSCSRGKDLDHCVCYNLPTSSSAFSWLFCWVSTHYSMIIGVASSSSWCWPNGINVSFNNRPELFCTSNERWSWWSYKSVQRHQQQRSVCSLILFAWSNICKHSITSFKRA